MTLHKIFISSLFTLCFSLLIIPAVMAGESTGTVSTGVSTGGPSGTVVAPPTLSPAAGSYTGTQSVSFDFSGAVYSCYTTDGTAPSCDWNNLTCSSGTKYSSALSVSSSQTIKAISCYAGGTVSSVGSNAYTISTSSSSGGGGGGGGGGGSSSVYLGCSPTLSNITPQVNAQHQSISAITVDIGNKASQESIKITDGDNELPLTITEDAGIFSVIADTSSLSLGQHTITISASSSAILSCAPRNYIYSLEVIGGTGITTPVNPTPEPTTDECSDYFDDTKNHWGKNYICYLKSRGIINGKNDGNFHPDDTITRAEATKIATLAFNVSRDSRDGSIFEDVHPGDWYYNYVIWAKNAGIINGRSNGNFDPNAAVSRAEALKIVLLSANKSIGSGTPNFPDVPADSWFAKYVNAAQNFGIIKGRSDGKFYPSASITRAEFSKIVTLLLQ